MKIKSHSIKSYMKTHSVTLPEAIDHFRQLEIRKKLIASRTILAGSNQDMGLVKVLKAQNEVLFELMHKMFSDK